ncbi:MAG TPA: hypothetical protein P5279_12350 [Anaerohalosphaeraceae bacterium]|nr:hypothetical protein [Anaerohalosphaeraceae bacterium]HRT51281.1 hypothetical protein [Anaerohalosphaeraceae bacterium]HRT88138.1 hypothetical protein [Anaerohalosphaeraceae bacterium]
MRAGEAGEGLLAEVRLEQVDEPLKGLLHGGRKVPEAEYVATCSIETEEHIVTSGGVWRDSRNSKFSYGWVKLTVPLLQTATGKTLSAKQKELITNYETIVKGETSQKAIFFFLGTDGQQAGKTAAAFVECLAAVAEKKRVEAEAEVKKWEEELEKSRTAYAEKSEQSKAAQEAFEAKRKQTHYLSEESAKEAIERMNTVIETQAIEHAVLKAKLEAVQEALAREEGIRKSTAAEAYNRQAIVLKLEEMRTEFGIEASALKARLEAAGKIRGDAEEYVRLENQRESLASETLGLAGQVGNANSELEKARTKRESVKAPKIVDNRIVVQPLAW